MADKIYRDSISVSCGRFTIRTNPGPGWATGRAIILNKPPNSRSTMRFGGLARSHLIDLQRALSEYLRLLDLED